MKMFWKRIRRTNRRTKWKRKKEILLQLHRTLKKKKLKLLLIRKKDQRKDKNVVFFL